LKMIVGWVLGTITGGIYSILAGLWCTWDKNRQCLWDKMGTTYVAHSPNGFKPETATERAQAAWVR
jgi:hypothetical protein